MRCVVEASVPEHVFIQTLFEYLVLISKSGQGEGGGGGGGGIIKAPVLNSNFTRLNNSEAVVVRHWDVSLIL